MKKISKKTVAAKVMAIILAALFIISAVGVVVFTTRAAEAEKQTGMTLQFADGRVAVTRKETP